MGVLDVSLKGSLNHIEGFAARHIRNTTLISDRLIDIT